MNITFNKDDLESILAVRGLLCAAANKLVDRKWEAYDKGQMHAYRELNAELYAARLLEAKAALAGYQHHYKKWGEEVYTDAIRDGKKRVAERRKEYKEAKREWLNP